MSFDNVIPQQSDYISTNKGIFALGEISTNFLYPLCMGLSSLLISIGRIMLNKRVINKEE